jgi:hypothetical protein
MQPIHSPLRQTVANINIDGINAWGKTAQIENVTSAIPASTNCWSMRQHRAV